MQLASEGSDKAEAGAGKKQRQVPGPAGKRGRAVPSIIHKGECYGDVCPTAGGHWAGGRRKFRGVGALGRGVKRKGTRKQEHGANSSCILSCLRVRERQAKGAAARREVYARGAALLTSKSSIPTTTVGRRYVKESVSKAVQLQRAVCGVQPAAGCESPPPGRRLSGRPGAGAWWRHGRAAAPP